MKKTKFTVIDALIILLVILVGAVAILKLAPGLFTAEEKQKVCFAVTATGVDEGISNVVEIGEEVSVSFSEKAYATVTGVSEKPHEESEFNKNTGKYVSQEIDGECDVTVLLECDAVITDTEIQNGEVAVRVGNEMPVRGKGYTIKGYVVDVYEAE